MLVEIALMIHFSTNIKISNFLIVGESGINFRYRRFGPKTGFTQYFGLIVVNLAVMGSIDAYR